MQNAPKPFAGLSAQQNGQCWKNVKAPGSLRLYNYTGTSLPVGGINADALRVFGYGGNDDITVNSDVGSAWVSGNTGDDKITLIKCNSARITPLTPSDLANGRPVDG